MEIITLILHVLNQGENQTSLYGGDFVTTISKY